MVGLKWRWVVRWPISKTNCRARTLDGCEPEVLLKVVREEALVTIFTIFTIVTIFIILTISTFVTIFTAMKGLSRTRTEILCKNRNSCFRLKASRNTALRLQLSGRKYIFFLETLKWKWKVVLLAFFLTVATVMPVYLQTKTAPCHYYRPCHHFPHPHGADHYISFFVHIMMIMFRGPGRKSRERPSRSWPSSPRVLRLNWEEKIFKILAQSTEGLKTELGWEDLIM